MGVGAKKDPAVGERNDVDRGIASAFEFAPVERFWQLGCRSLLLGAACDPGVADHARRIESKFLFGPIDSGADQRAEARVQGFEVVSLWPPIVVRRHRACRRKRRRSRLQRLRTFQNLADPVLDLVDPIGDRWKRAVLGRKFEMKKVGDDPVCGMDRKPVERNFRLIEPVGGKRADAFKLLGGHRAVDVAAVAALDPGYALLCRSLGASRRDTLFKVLGRAALPGLVAGVRVGLALSIISVLVGEILTSTAGLGYLISTSETLFDTGRVYLGVALALCIAWLGNRFIGFLEGCVSVSRVSRTRAPEVQDV